MIKNYDLEKIHTLLINGFTESELRDDLCFYKFRPVFDQLSKESGKKQIAQHLIEYAHQKVQVDKLLVWAKEHNPPRYEWHRPYYSESYVEIGIKANSSNFTPAKQFLTISGIASILMLPRDLISGLEVLEVPDGDITLYIEMPTELIDSLLEKYKSNEPIIQYLEIQEVKSIDRQSFLHVLPLNKDIKESLNVLLTIDEEVTNWDRVLERRKDLYQVWVSLEREVVKEEFLSDLKTFIRSLEYQITLRLAERSIDQCKKLIEKWRYWLNRIGEPMPKSEINFYEKFTRSFPDVPIPNGLGLHPNEQIASLLNMPNSKLFNWQDHSELPTPMTTKSSLDVSDNRKAFLVYQAVYLISSENKKIDL